MSEYTPESLKVCLKVVRSLNAESGLWGPKCVVIGGLVPVLLGIDRPEWLSPHLGTTDVDLGIQIATTEDDGELYRTLKSVLTGLKFQQTEPSFAWTREVDGFPAKIELFGPVKDPSEAGRAQKRPFAQSGSGLTTLGVYGLDLLHLDTESVPLGGDLLDERGTKEVNISVCGPAMLLLLKAWALHGRTKEKDGYDVVWLLKAVGPESLATRFVSRGLNEHDAGKQALEFLWGAFHSMSDTGPSGWVSLNGFTGEEADFERRNAAAIVQDFVKQVNALAE